MERIIKAKETMSARERVLRTFRRERTDRVTIGYEANEGIHARLKAALGAGSDEELLQMLGVDYRPAGAAYIGPALYPEKPGYKVHDLEGCYMRWVEHETGGYWDFCDFPLQGADDETIAAYPIPNPDDFDYDGLYEQMKNRDPQYAYYLGNPGIPDVINSNGRIMGMEDVLVHLAIQDEAAMSFIRRRAAMLLEVMRRSLERCKGMIDFIWLGEDLGTQIGPMISLDLYRKTLGPIHQQFIDLAKEYGLPSIMHTCGSSSWVYEDLIAMGITGVDTLQPEAANMAPAYLKERFGGRLCFRGCISTAGPVAYGTAEETANYCREILRIMMPGYGYHFAPTHMLQDNSPVENVIAMYQTAHTCGVYPATP
jgi:uroporphyrinogen decarboxylase